MQSQRATLDTKEFNKKVRSLLKDMTGQVIIITGANSGIGKEAARVLAHLGATVIMAARDEQRTLPVLQAIKDETKNANVDFIRLDLSDLESVKQFAETFKSRYQNLHILINNAGVMSIRQRTLTKDGFEMQFGTNHLGHFYLTTLLTDVLKKSALSRVITVSSDLHESGKMQWDDLMLEKGYSPNTAYSQSKLANVLFAKELNRRLAPFNVKSVSLHPGVIRTELTRHMKNAWWWFLAAPLYPLVTITPIQGTQTTLYCALEDHNNLVGGSYLANCKITKESSRARKEEDQKRLWELSEKYISQVEHKNDEKISSYFLGK